MFLNISGTICLDIFASAASTLTVPPRYVNTEYTFNSNITGEKRLTFILTVQLAQSAHDDLILNGYLV